MPPFARYLLATVSGIIVTLAIVVGIEALGSRLYPMPPGLDLSNAEAYHAYVHGLPVAALLLVLLGWVAGTFTGSWVAGTMAGAYPLRFAGVIGGLTLAATIANLVALAHPAWFSIASVVAVPAAAWLGARLVSRRAS